MSKKNAQMDSVCYEIVSLPFSPENNSKAKLSCSSNALAVLQHSKTSIFSFPSCKFTHLSLKASAVALGTNCFDYKDPSSSLFAVALKSKIEIYRTTSTFAHMDPIFLISSEVDQIIQIIWISSTSLILISRNAKIQGVIIANHEIKKKCVVKISMSYVDKCIIENENLIVFGLDCQNASSVQIYKVIDSDNLTFEPPNDVLKPSAFQSWLSCIRNVFSEAPSEYFVGVDQSPSKQLFITLTKTGRTTLYKSLSAQIINSWSSSQIINTEDGDEEEIITHAFFWTDSVFLFGTSLGRISFVPLNRIAAEFFPINLQFLDVSLTVIPDDR